MNPVREFLRDKPASQRLMIVAILLLAVSQFLPYMDEEPRARPDGQGNTVINAYAREYEPGTGWETHPQAYVLLLLLAFAFLRDDIASSPTFARYGWWASWGCVVACTVPGAYLRTSGGALGGIAALLALGAVLLHVRASRAAGAKPAAST